ncbi:MAG: hypothetical protein IMF14_05815 [Proteobacteria bacterium]|nr:hypothetical protein [Pseudomonadota bacterium]
MKDKSSKKCKTQKSVYYLGIVSFIASVTCLVILYLRIDDSGLKNTISASLAASSFFFASVGVVLTTIGKCNLPSFKIGDHD